MENEKGSKSEIESMKVISAKSDYDLDGKYKKGLQRETKVIKIMTKEITKINNKEGEEVTVSASELFNLKEVEGEWGISKSRKAKIQIFMKKQKVSSMRELVGTGVTVRARTKELADNQTQTFLGFYTG